MLSLLADECFNAVIRRAVEDRTGMTIVTAQQVGLVQTPDEAVLSFGFVVLTHDISTMVPEAAERVRSARPMPGIVAVVDSTPVGRAIEDLAVLLLCTPEQDFRDGFFHVPL